MDNDRDETSNGGSSRKDIVYESQKKNRQRWDWDSDSETSVDLMIPHRKVFASDKADSLKPREGIEIASKLCKNGVIKSGRKRSWIDDIECEEDEEENGFVGKKQKKELPNSRVTRVLRSGGGGGGVLGSKSPKQGEKQIDNSETSCGKPVKYQGKNGVLKVILKDKKKLRNSEKNHGTQEEDKTRRVTRSAGTLNSKAPLSPPTPLEKKLNGKLGLSLKKEKKNVKSWKVASNKKSETFELRSDVIEVSTTMGSKDVEDYSKKEKERTKEDRTFTFKLGVSKRSKGGKRKGDVVTQKESIREQIREMIVEAGWTIQYRQRLSKDYQDAIYVDLKGREHWSITKAYYAHKKQCEEDGSPFTPIPEEVISQLTRQTKKKIEREQLNKVLQKTSIAKEKSEKRLKIKNALKKKGTAKQSKIHRTSPTSDANLLPGRRHKKQKGRALLVRGSNKGLNSDNDDFIPYSGKRTVLSWLIDLGTVLPSEKVKYMNSSRKKTMLDGWITRDGIHCCCCSKIVTVSEFEIHAGSKLCQPFENIIVESGLSLFQCQLDAWNKQEESDRKGFHLVDVNGDDPNDDTCGICGDGGDLICCDGCPSTFHQSCLCIQILPQGDWNCPNCSCKFCGLPSGSVDKGKDTGVPVLLKCRLCEEKYHKLCCHERDASVMSKDLSTTFCGMKCRELFMHLQKLIGVKHELGDGFAWSLIQRSDLDTNASNYLHPQKAAYNSKLAVALTVMDECFVPIVDHRSGISLIRNVIYSCGSNFNRLSYSGFYTAILERGDEIVSAATIRFHGTNFAEMPFIGTRHIYRRQGMFRRLLYAIESALSSLNVERLIIPAISELIDTWTLVFGFKRLEEFEKQELKSINMLVFPGTGLLQKLLLNQKSAVENTSDGSGNDVVVGKTIEPKISDNSMLELTDKSDIGFVAEPDVCVSENGIIDHEIDPKHIVADIKCDTQASGDMLCGNLVVSNELEAAHEPELLPLSGMISASDPEFLASDVTHPNKLEIENGNISGSPVKLGFQSSNEETVNENGEVDEVNADLEPDCDTLAEISVEQVTCEYPTTVSSHDYKSIASNPVQSKADLDQYMQEVKC